MTAHDPADWPTPSRLMRKGVAAEDIRCWACDRPWDGTTPNALPACVACRRMVGQALRAWVELVVDAAETAQRSKQTA